MRSKKIYPDGMEVRQYGLDVVINSAIAIVLNVAVIIFSFRGKDLGIPLGVAFVGVTTAVTTIINAINNWRLQRQVNKAHERMNEVAHGGKPVKIKVHKKGVDSDVTVS